MAGVVLEHQVSFALVSVLVGEGSGIAKAPLRQRLKVTIVQNARAEKQKGLAVMAKQIVPLSAYRAC